MRIFLVQFVGGEIFVDGSECHGVEFLGKLFRVLHVCLLVGFCAEEAGDAVAGVELLSGLIAPHFEGHVCTVVG